MNIQYSCIGSVIAIIFAVGLYIQVCAYLFVGEVLVYGLVSLIRGCFCRKLIMLLGSVVSNSSLILLMLGNFL